MIEVEPFETPEVLYSRPWTLAVENLAGTIDVAILQLFLGEVDMSDIGDAAHDSALATASLHCQMTPKSPTPATIVNARNSNNFRPSPGPLNRPFPDGDRPRLDRHATEPVVEIIGQGRGRVVAPSRVLLQALQADDLQVARNGAVERRGSGRRRLADLLERLGDRIAAERRAAGQEGVEDRPQAVDVAGRRHGPAPARGLLGRHVGRRAHDRAAVGQLAVALDPLGQAEIGHVGLALLVEQDVGRLEIAVQDAPLVRVVDGLGGQLQQPRGGFRIVRCNP